MLKPHQIFDHHLLIESNIPRLRNWMSGIIDILHDDLASGKKCSESLISHSAPCGINLRMTGSCQTKTFALCEHGLTKDILSFDPSSSNQGLMMLGTMSESLKMMDGEDAVQDLQASGYAEQAFCTEMSTWLGDRPIAFERLALNHLVRITDEDLKKAIEEGTTPRLRVDQVRDAEETRNDDRLARFLDTRGLLVETPMDCDHPNGKLIIKKRMGMVHIGPYNTAGLMFLGNHVCLPERLPETILASLRGQSLRDVVDMPMPFDGIHIASAVNKGAGVQIETDGYDEGIRLARSFPCTKD